jgi:hypothetical protein
MKIKEAMEKGLTKLRLPHWANPDAHIELYKDERGYGPWATLVDSWGERAFTKEEYDKLKKILIVFDTDDRWVPYESTQTSEEYYDH